MLSVPAYAVPNSIVNVDINGVGQYASMAVDVQGLPIISYYNAAQQKLKVAHCFDKNCSTFNSIVTPDAASNIGEFTAIALDHNGNPVVSYYDISHTALKVLHCGNSSCTTGNTITTPDATGTAGQYTAITVDASNRPVVTYYYPTKGILRVLHCGNPACSSSNIIVEPDTATSNGVQSSIKLNSLGNPVIAYFDFTNKSLKVLHCGNANCTAGNNIVTADSGNDVGRYPSLVLDGKANPAISYLDLTNGKLKIIRCGNNLCSAGNTITTPVTSSGVAGYFSSLVLASSGFPVVSFFNLTNGALNVLRCGNATCTSGNTFTVPDSGNVGEYTTLALDASGFPVVSYYDFSHGALKVLHCGSLTCSPNSDVVADPATIVGQYGSLKLDANGRPVISYWDETNGHLKLIHCGDSACSSGNNIATPDTNGNTGWDTSLVLDAQGFPVVSYYDFTAGSMKVLHCSNANCTGANTITNPDILSFRHTSLALDTTGHPVVASAGQSNEGLRIVHCGDTTCTANNVISSPDFPVFPFQADVRGVSLVLDTSGNPVVSFYRADITKLKLLHCDNPTCSGSTNSIVALDPGVQASDHRSTSLTLDANGNPVIAYQDIPNNVLKVLHCGNANCTTGNTIAVVVTTSEGGFEPSIKLDSNGNPVVSYGTMSGGLFVVHCGNAACTSGNTSSVGDAAATAGWDTSLALDVSGNPVVSYYNGTNLKVLHCGKPNCT